MSHAQAKHTQEDSALLQRETLLAILGKARRDFEEEGSLHPLLILELRNGAGFMTALQMPDAPKRKDRMFQAIGQIIHLCESAIKDAVLLTETWIVAATEAPDATKSMPSQHPCRQEAIVLMGRNAARTRAAIVIQPFSRDEHNAPVWSKPKVAISDSPTKGRVAWGPLDALFGN